MNGFKAFLKKELKEIKKTGKLVLFAILFSMFGIMNPAFAKLTPKLFEMLSDTIQESGLVYTEITVTAINSWEQFYKNIPIALIILLIVFSNIFTYEYDKGTLVIMITKGLSRSSVVLSKAIVMLLTWTAGFWLCYSITFVYTEYYWDNNILKYLFFPAACWWLMGICIISLEIFFSVISKSSTTVMLLTGGCFGLLYLLKMIPKIKIYLPIYLADAMSVANGQVELIDVLPSVCITCASSIFLWISSVLIFKKKSI